MQNVATAPVSVSAPALPRFADRFADRTHAFIGRDGAVIGAGSRHAFAVRCPAGPALHERADAAAYRLLAAFADRTPVAPWTNGAVAHVVTSPVRAALPLQRSETIRGPAAYHGLVARIPTDGRTAHGIGVRADRTSRACPDHSADVRAARERLASLTSSGLPREILRGARDHVARMEAVRAFRIGDVVLDARHVDSVLRVVGVGALAFVREPYDAVIVEGPHGTGIVMPRFQRR